MKKLLFFIKKLSFVMALVTCRIGTIVIVSFLLLVSCSNSQTKLESSSASIPRVSDARIIDPNLDILSLEAKDEKFNELGKESNDRVDTYCPDCDKRCCIHCFSGGSKDGGCVKLKFKDCTECNHSSAKHYPVKSEN